MCDICYALVGSKLMLFYGIDDEEIIEEHEIECFFRHIHRNKHVWLNS